jgi:hypothetical protein
MRLPKFGEVKAMRLVSISKMEGGHTPATAQQWKMANDMQRIGLLVVDARGRFVLTEYGRSHLVELDRQKQAAIAERGW